MTATIETRRIRIDGFHVVCLVAGDPAKTPILMVHGWAHHPYVWRRTMEALSADYYCIAVGLLGFGDSDKVPHSRYTIASHARNTLAVADALGVQRFVLIGQSRGGQIALWLAAYEARERVIALVDISGVVTGRVSWYLRGILGGGMWAGYHMPVFFTILRRLWAIRPVSRLFYHPYFFRWNAQTAEMTQQDGVFAFAPGADTVNWPAMREMIGTNVLSALPQINVPTLVLFGKQDRVVPPREGILAAQTIPFAHLVLLDHCGHYPMVDQFATYIRTLRQFLETQQLH